ncbi:MAG: hypothetical protein RLZZ450_3747 [Pseudomonadota bacterium]
MRADRIGRYVSKHFWEIASLALVAACARPPVSVTPTAWQQRYLRDAPGGVTGELKRTSDGIWCSDDDAFSIPIAPFSDGPTSIRDAYEGWGVTCALDMFDRHESVVEVLRTRIRSDESQENVLKWVAEDVFSFGQDEPELSTQWVSQNGLRQVQQVNRAAMYDGREDVSMLGTFHGIASGDHTNCRVDRHFVGAQYYFHIIAVAYHPEPPVDPCAFALELASWTAEKIRVGKGCGNRMEPKD